MRYLKNPNPGADEADDEGTLLRSTSQTQQLTLRQSQENNFLHHKTKSRVNGTSEVKQVSNTQAAGENNSSKPVVISKILEKGKASLSRSKSSLSRSKSELGEQHKKMISNWSRAGKNHFANIENKFKRKTSITSTDGQVNTTTSTAKRGSSRKDSLSNHIESNGSPTENGRKNNENDLDGLMKNLGLDVMNAKRSADRVPVIPNYSDRDSQQNDNGHLMISDQNNLMMSDVTIMSTSLLGGLGQQNGQIFGQNSQNQLEKHLENDYGEFEFIDEAATLTRTVKTNGETVNTDDHRKSMFSFSDEVFDELEKSGTLRKGVQGNGTTDGAVFDSQFVDSQSPNNQMYETYGAWRQRNRQKQGLHYNNNNTSVTKNTSAKLQALIADQTLLLRHHKRRQHQKEQQRWQQQQHIQQKTCQIDAINDSCLEREEQLQSLLLLQQQLAAATKEHLESSTNQGSMVSNSYSAITMAPLRRCSSLSQTANCELDDSSKYVY